MEAIILTLDVACMVYVCWRLYKADPKAPEADDLGWFAYRKDGDA